MFDLQAALAVPVSEAHVVGDDQAVGARWLAPRHEHADVELVVWLAVSLKGRIGGAHRVRVGRGQRAGRCHRLGAAERHEGGVIARRLPVVLEPQAPRLGALLGLAVPSGTAAATRVALTARISR